MSTKKKFPIQIFTTHHNTLIENCLSKSIYEIFYKLFRYILNEPENIKDFTTNLNFSL